MPCRRNRRRPLQTHRRNDLSRHDQNRDRVAHAYEFHSRTNDHFGHVPLLGPARAIVTRSGKWDKKESSQLGALPRRVTSPRSEKV
jgi:hypothetical protein